MGANFDSFPPNCHPEPDSGAQDFDIRTSIRRFRNKFGMMVNFCHAEAVSGSFRLRKKFMEANCIEK